MFLLANVNTDEWLALAANINGSGSRGGKRAANIIHTMFLIPQLDEVHPPLETWLEPAEFGPC